MMRSHFDTIVAPITGGASAPVAVIRVSGSDAWDVTRAVFEPWPSDPKPRYAHFGTFANGDEGFALPFEEGRSFTGERSVEFSIHGSSASVRSLLALCHAAGARPALPGEFTQRAFLNGRIDLTQAEAVKDTVDADTEAQLKVANLNRHGALSAQIKEIVHDLIGVLASIEASVDFSEEVGEIDRLAAAERVESCLRRTEALHSQSFTSRLMRNGLRIAIVGPPNAGKSSLLNALLRSNRAIVSSIAGTTRDTVEERCDFMGYPVVLIDTAGIRATHDPIEAEGMSRALEAAKGADLVWFVYDSGVGLGPADLAALAGLSGEVLLLANKCDLQGDPLDGSTEKGTPISAKTGFGLDDLVRRTCARFAQAPAAPSVNERHAELLASTRGVLLELRDHLRGETPPDLLTVLIGEALAFLGEITGDSAHPDILDRIFRDFCLGK